MPTFAIVFVILVLVALVVVAGVYNRLVTLKNRTKNAFAQIDVQLKRRFDLIPNLLEVAKKYLSHERETLQNVVEARSAAMKAGQALAENPVDAQQMQDFLAAERTLKGKMLNFMAIAEAYPDLKSNETMMQLSEELTSTENKISFSRQAFNDAVMVYNTSLEVFPNNILAKAFNFKPGELFRVDDPQERDPVRVSFEK